MAEPDRDNNFPPDTKSGTTEEKDFGRTDRYANKDNEQDFNFTTTGDGTAWDRAGIAQLPMGRASKTPCERRTRRARESEW